MQKESIKLVYNVPIIIKNKMSKESLCSVLKHVHTLYTIIILIKELIIKFLFAMVMKGLLAAAADHIITMDTKTFYCVLTLSRSLIIFYFRAKNMFQ
jgi:hypothetical protein